MRSVKTATVLIEDTAFASFFHPRREAFGRSSDPAQGICHPWQKSDNTQGLAGGMELTDALVWA